MTCEVTQDEILAGLRCLSVQPTSHLMVHGSLSSFGRVQGGAATVVAALAAAAGRAGAVIAPSFCDAIRSDGYSLRACADLCPQPLCASRERGYTGAIGEAMREHPDVLRSCHPTHSWVGIGGDARFLLDGHQQSPTPCGRESPFFRLLQRDGLLVLLGVGVNSITNIHAVEDVRNVPYLSAFDPLRRHATYTTSGRRLQYRYPQLLQKVLNECGLVRTTQIGAAKCDVLSARELGAFLWIVTEDDPWCLVLRPRGNAYDPAVDAQAKVERMAAIWQRHRDDQAWQAMLDASCLPVEPIPFAPSTCAQTRCPAYRGTIRGYHRCAANDLPPWEKFTDYPADEPGVATCETCNWRPGMVDNSSPTSLPEAI